MKVLADPLRMRIVSLLAHETLCTTHLMEETGARQTNLSNHLRLLREAGVVETEPCGRFTYYRLRPEALESLSEGLAGLAAAARATDAAQNRRAC
ncbi:metalloregulator ArsR/SmtB family transcription factor [Nocardiopsis exhalans]|uniref:Metalloregulator ArsR/SmtB family transcription factor n=1 Tax=Nocardiopsis exhalans TaxID=163604 RepID=A0ABY5DJP9_9ACTN|nr:metalloregulator ArsR/SmtB family transcription factor [Nocardiopsis exhalans]USY23501.1 metalloregulator ArsR/SmtB family transcription factor [Nocardiopsis exhalans]